MAGRTLGWAALLIGAALVAGCGKGAVDALDYDQFIRKFGVHDVSFSSLRRYAGTQPVSALTHVEGDSLPADKLTKPLGYVSKDVCKIAEDGSVGVERQTNMGIGGGGGEIKPEEPPVLYELQRKHLERGQRPAPRRSAE